MKLRVTGCRRGSGDRGPGTGDRGPGTGDRGPGTGDRRSVPEQEAWSSGSMKECRFSLNKKQPLS
ncbi:hypothetical protein E4A48_16385 [Xanthomonas cerealis pv. cerealis]|uniref:Uncharacterized protein n=1 Tax=Xanthomonas cerealis pv. cerealis TaxID=152263 RepID=A0A514EG98_9XANT|nr:hypothetical protein E4A48_16385 [Xanthomonas translucens pv. cerealis]